MTNLTKWLIAIPFSFLLAFALPRLISGRWLWFLEDWGATVYVVLTAAMWLIATAFVDVTRPRPKQDLANKLISWGLILCVPLAVLDVRYGWSAWLPAWTKWIAVLLSLLAMGLGLAARGALGKAYAPRAAVQARATLVEHGAYRYIRHPLYLAALLWCIGWPLFAGSLVACLFALCLTAPAIHLRIKAEEQALLAEYGEAYRVYQQRSWRLLPYIY